MKDSKCKVVPTNVPTVRQQIQENTEALVTRNTDHRIVSAEQKIEEKNDIIIVALTIQVITV